MTKLEPEEVEELGRYADLEGAELGEACNLLYSLNGYRYALSDEFNMALDEEIKQQLANFRENFVVKTAHRSHEWDEEYLEERGES